MNIQNIINFATDAFPVDTHYWKGLQKAHDAQHPPIPKPIGIFDTCRPGLTGLNRLRRVYKYIRAIECARFKGTPNKLDENQHAMLTLFIATALPHIVTPAEYAVHRKTLCTVCVCVHSPVSSYLKEIKYDKDKRWAYIMAARQAGKTLALSMACTATMAACPDIDIGLYASKQSQAGLIQTNVIENFALLKLRIDVCKADGTTRMTIARLLSPCQAWSRFRTAPSRAPPSAHIL